MADLLLDDFHAVGVEFLLALFADGSLCGGEAGDRNAERAAGDIGQAELMAELDGGRIAAVLAADADVQLRTDLLAHGAGHLHQLADADLIVLIV